MPDLPSREELGRHLVTARIAGSVQTPVADVLRKADLVAAGDPDHCFGLSGMHRYTQADVLAEITRQFGWVHTPGEPGDGIAFRFHEHRRRIIYVGWVAVLASGANLYHTHEAHPMELVLEQANEVDLVVGDHGWAGAAAERGIDVVAVADINDPALPMAKAEGRAGVVLGMDDNVRPTPSAYDPLADYLLARLLP